MLSELKRYLYKILDYKTYPETYQLIRNKFGKKRADEWEKCEILATDGFIKLKDLLTGIVRVPDDNDIIIKGISTTVDKIKPGYLFIAPDRTIKLHTIKIAKENGAIAVMYHEKYRHFIAEEYHDLYEIPVQDYKLTRELVIKRFEENKKTEKAMYHFIKERVGSESADGKPN